MSANSHIPRQHFPSAIVDQVLYFGFCAGKSNMTLCELSPLAVPFGGVVPSPPESVGRSSANRMDLAGLTSRLESRTKSALNLAAGSLSELLGAEAVREWPCVRSVAARGRPVKRSRTWLRSPRVCVRDRSSSSSSGRAIEGISGVPEGCCWEVEGPIAAAEEG
jgi:hypothetical protein